MQNVCFKIKFLNKTNIPNLKSQLVPRIF